MKQVLKAAEHPTVTSVTAESHSIIRSYRDKLSSLSDGEECIRTLAEMGAKLYEGAEEPPILKAPPTKLHETKSFRLPIATENNEDERTYFIFDSTLSSEYRLIKGCISSIYLAVRVDPEGMVHVDGTSDSLITKAMLALILDEIEGRSSNDIMQMQSINIGGGSPLKEIGIIRRNGVETILKHIKDEIISQRNTEMALKTPQQNKSHKRVAVLVSGGVDSSVALWLLMNQGYDVEAFYLKVWGIANDNEPGQCDWETDIDYLMKICETLNVPLHIIPFQEIYRSCVIEPFVEGTRCGETPNPDVFCNEFVKFGSFLEYAKRWGFTHVASGHYARLEGDTLKVPSRDNEGNKIYIDEVIQRLCLAKDTGKDQTYFLSRLSQEQLKHVMFPLGNLLKKEVRHIARTLHFPNHDRKDSMGLCFLGKVNVRSFLRGYVGHQPGPIIDEDSNEVLGEHSGLYNFTIGQREGIAPFLSSAKETHKCRYVVRKEPETNTLYVTSCYNSDKYVSKGSIRRCFRVTDIKWNVPDFASFTRGNDARLQLKLRHSTNYMEGIVTFDDIEDPVSANVSLHKPDVGIASGQYAVFYSDDKCIGAGKMVA
ncbi:hypothetical protein BgAZ_105270 [Babesia gibsoni]|uniref:tRNA-5-taurinomethyluridine 2-sulfurtransferase n=1 Tax=Babesia gibsoni TaxID=33632 RepID=A0AAD8PFT1_BABGI|nr:hypothetical protein BgAZ_105270 [Babesia gibsoni]